MEEEADCGDGCRFKGKEVGSVIFFYVKIAFRKTVFLPDLFFSCMEAAFQVDLFSEISRTVKIFTYTILKKMY